MLVITLRTKTNHNTNIFVGYPLIVKYDSNTSTMLNDICVPVQNQELDCQGHVSLSVCVQWLERWLFVLFDIGGIVDHNC
jgi:hypothetical protein